MTPPPAASDPVRNPRVLIAAGGTAGHVVPSLAVAAELTARGADVVFAGTAERIESRLVPAAGYPLHTYHVTGFPRKPSFGLIRGLGLAAVAPALAQAPENGDELARMMIAQAETGGGRVDMHRFGDGACFVAEGLSAAYVARRQFSGYPVAYREADPGNGLWFILLADHGKANVRIYAIKQGVLRWDVPENARVGDAMVCSDTADISTSAAVGSGPLFKPVPRSR